MRKLVLGVSAVLIALPTFGAAALAQGRDVDVFFDERGQRIIMDPETGEIIAVEPPRRVVRERAPRVERRDDGGQDGGQDGGPYDLSDPLDRERFERDRDVLIGRRDAPARPDYREPGFAEPRFEEPVYAEPEDRDVPPLADDDLARPDDGPDPGEDTQTATVEPIERRPLGDPAATGSIIEPSTQLPPPGGPLTSTPSPTVVDPAVVPQMPGKGSSDAVAKIQILLDRAGASPGVIDGRMGDNVNKAISAYRDIKGQPLRTYDEVAIESELAATGGPAFTEYTITNEDVAAQFVASIPEDYSEKAQLERMAFTSVTEMLGERFHMDENYLKSINPGINFDRPGSIVKVVNTGENVKTKVAKIIADKANKQVRGYDAAGKLIVVYPSTIGSSDTPSPTGLHAVSRIAFDPNYTYNPKLNFKQGENDKVLTIPPGPNGPVGSIWIALDRPTYGIHGTPEPSKIGKTESHGCVRLTNWDATELAKIVSAGVTVDFVQ